MLKKIRIRIKIRMFEDTHVMISLKYIMHKGEIIYEENR